MIPGCPGMSRVHLEKDQFPVLKNAWPLLVLSSSKQCMQAKTQALHHSIARAAARI